VHISKIQACPLECHSCGNPVGWDVTAHICISHETVACHSNFRNRMRVSGWYWIVILRLLWRPEDGATCK